MTMTLIQHQELGSAQASITFSSIPQTYTDLLLKVSLRTSRSASEDTVRLQFNSSTANYSGRWLRADDANNTASNTISDRNLVLYQNTASTTANTFANAEIYITNYGLSQSKAFSIDTVQENNGGSWRAIIGGLWNDSAAITSITLSPNVGPNLVQYSSATLYGILKGSNGVTVS
jgi:hypothetical protein